MADTLSDRDLPLHSDAGCEASGLGLRPQEAGCLTWGAQAARIGFCLCLGMLVAGSPSIAPAGQQSSLPSSPGPEPAGGGANTPSSRSIPQDPMAHRVEEHMAERRNTDRQRMLVADTDKLLVLAQQLKADVDKSNKDELSIDVVKRAEQIEKLARSVKDKMRGN